LKNTDFLDSVSSDAYTESPFQIGEAERQKNIYEISSVTKAMESLENPNFLDVSSSGAYTETESPFQAGEAEKRLKILEISKTYDINLDEVEKFVADAQPMTEQINVCIHYNLYHCSLEQNK